MCEDGMCVQAGVVSGSFSAASVTGRCVDAINCAWGRGTSAANWAGNLSCWMYRSCAPVERVTGAASAAPRELPGNLPERLSLRGEAFSVANEKLKV